MAHKGVQFDDAGEDIQKRAPIAIVVVDRHSAVAARRHVVAESRRQDSERAGHGEPPCARGGPTPNAEQTFAMAWEASRGGDLRPREGGRNLVG